MNKEIENPFHTFTAFAYFFYGKFLSFYVTLFPITFALLDKSLNLSKHPSQKKNDPTSTTPNRKQLKASESLNRSLLVLKEKGKKDTAMRGHTRC